MSLLHERAGWLTARTYPWTVLFILSALEGLTALAALASLPSDVENSRFLGFSASRLAVLGLLLGLSLACAGLAALSMRPAWRIAWAERMRAGAWLGSLAFIFLPVSALICALVPTVLLSLYRTAGDFRYFAYSQRLSALCIWGFLFCLQAWVILLWTGRFHRSALGEQRPVLRAVAVIGGIAALLVIFVTLTGIGINPDLVGWGRPTVALMEWQVWLAWTAGGVFLYFLLHRRWPARADVLMGVAIWLLAVGIWLSQPVRPTFFATAGRAPNQEIYPFSDGAYYGLFAQNVLIGNGFKGDEIPARPLYVTLLAGFHLIAGQRYEGVIAIQTLLLAGFPVVLYFLGKQLHSRPAGLVMALLAILRELNAVIAMPFTNNASNSKLFFADLPTALVISLWVLLAVIWLKAPTRRPLLPLGVGGMLGLVMLFRTQSILLLPGVLLLALLVLRRHWRVWLIAAVLMTAGLAITVAPWLWRNAQITGQPIFDDVRSQTGWMANRYSLEGESNTYVLQPGESFGDFAKRANRGVLDFTLTHPGVVAQFIGSHWLNAEIASVLVLPLRSGLSEPKEILVPIQPFWDQWVGQPSLAQTLLLLFYLLLVVIGVSAAWVRAGWAGLVPLLANLSYHASTALARNSGGRYLLPVDWVAYAYAALGLMEIAVGTALLLGISWNRLAGELSHVEPLSAKLSKLRYNLWAAAAVALLFCLIGSLPVLAERVVPTRYPIQTQAALAAEVLQSQPVMASAINRASLERFLLQPGTRISKGRVLYPRFYEAGQGEPNTAKTGFEPLPYARTVFLLASNGYNGLVMLKADQPPAYLPNTADVLVVGCDADKYQGALLILVSGQPDSLILSGSDIPQTCPAVTQ